MKTRICTVPMKDTKKGPQSSQDLRVADMRGDERIAKIQADWQSIVQMQVASAKKTSTDALAKWTASQQILTTLLGYEIGLNDQ